MLIDDSHTKNIAEACLYGHQALAEAIMLAIESAECSCAVDEMVEEVDMGLSAVAWMLHVGPEGTAAALQYANRLTATTRP